MPGWGHSWSVEESDLKLVEKVQRASALRSICWSCDYQHKVLKLIMRYVHDATEVRTSHRRRS